jgi:Rhodopirellula transposase DDE domain
VYDIGRNEAYMTLGTSGDTSVFSVDAIIKWWHDCGKRHYPEAVQLLILADGGGSNSSRHYVFKQELERLADETGLLVRVAHYPPYASKYNPIEHKVFCHISRKLKSVILEQAEYVVDLMQSVTTSTGLKVLARLVETIYLTGKKVTAEYKEKMRIVFDEQLKQWNYWVAPQLG